MTIRGPVLLCAMIQTVYAPHVVEDTLPIFLKYKMHKDCDSKTHEVGDTYGEISERGMGMLLAKLPSSCAITPDSTFVDVGSGFGRWALYVRMFTRAARVVGLELNSCRHHQAARMREDLRNSSEYRRSARGLRYIHGDARKFNWSTATHVFLSTTAMPNDVLEELFVTLAKTPSVRCILIHELMPEGILGYASMRSFGVVASKIRAPSTWSSSTYAIALRRGECSWWDRWWDGCMTAAEACGASHLC